MPTNGDLNRPDIGPGTAQSEEQDADFAEEHTRLTGAGEPTDENSGESVPTRLRRHGRGT